MTLPKYPHYQRTDIPWIGSVPVEWHVKRIVHTSYVKGRVGWKGLTSDEYKSSGYANLVTGTDFSSRYINWKTCHFVDKDRYDDDPFIQLENGDLLITKDGTIGKLALVKDLSHPACLNSGIFLVRPRNSYIAEYLYWVLSSEVFKVFCDLASHGSTIKHLYQNVFEDFSFPVPPVSEQRWIVRFLDRETAKIDELVAEQERLITLLKEKRQAVISHAVTKGLNPDVPMKDSGHDGLPEVPAHWKSGAIKRFCVVITDGAHISPDTNNGVFPFVSTKDIGIGSIDFSGCLKTSESSYRYLERTGCRPIEGDILFSKDGTIGKTVVVSESIEFVVASSLIIIRPNKNVLSPEFLHIFCQSKFVINQVESFVKGAGLPRLSIANLQKISVLVPKADEQNEIVRAVSEKIKRVDALVEQASRAIKLLKERRSALISAAVTGKIDVRGLVDTEEAA